LYDYTAQAEGDLSFKVGDRIEVVQKGEDGNEWWVGKVGGKEGQFPANYTKLE
jgi:amphiphysin